MPYLNIIFISLAMVGFALVHSLTAGERPKEMLKSRLDARLVEGWYRLAYNLFSGLTVLPVVILLALLPDRMLYTIPMPWLIASSLGQLAGVMGLIGALFVTDIWRFIGLRQALAYLSGEPLPLPHEPFQMRGMYALVRHPLYFFSLLVLWLTPVMTLNVLVFNVGATLYFLIGSRIEERRLERIYGDAYREYRRRVSGLIPLPRPGGRRSEL